VDKDMFWVDRHARIVVRGRRAVALSILQFAIFDALHRVGAKNGKQLLSAKLYDEVYRGVAEPPQMQTIRVTIQTMNRVSLSYLRLKIRGNNHREHSFYQIVSIL
jgi:hypothetical protein